MTADDSGGGIKDAAVRESTPGRTFSGGADGNYGVAGTVMEEQRRLGWWQQETRTVTVRCGKYSTADLKTASRQTRA